MVWIQSFLSRRPTAMPRLKSLFCPTIYVVRGRIDRCIHFSKLLALCEIQPDLNGAWTQFRYPFLTTITVTPWIHQYIYIYVCVCVCVCVSVCLCACLCVKICCRSKERNKCFKMNKSTKKFVFFKDLYIYFVLAYVYVSNLLLFSENIYSTWPCE